MRFGFKLTPESNPSCIDTYESDNYSSATSPDFKPEMDSLLTTELALGHISMAQTKLRCVNPIGRVPEKYSGKSLRLQLNAWYFLNDHIERDLESFCTNSTDAAVSFYTNYCFTQ